MRKFALAAAGIAAMAGVGFAQDEEANAEAAATDGACALTAIAPSMPDPKSASADDRAATIAAIKDYQAALGEYRACLDGISGNEELDNEAREQALKDFNATVEDETKMVEDWQKFDKKYQKANK
ncbi:hypothetical protein [Hyphococcus sp.]|uniref:hypothetical protein n=1 Tax=Hyphococcus sp. TaxID=2038636 RepID=UPI002081C4C0|nr:MAG: hypothetical protein DHS20C04_17620 [Marinicaulis sp.]